MALIDKQPQKCPNCGAATSMFNTVKDQYICIECDAEFGPQDYEPPKKEND